jgi:hypothetical protein
VLAAGSVERQAADLHIPTQPGESYYLARAYRTGSLIVAYSVARAGDIADSRPRHVTATLG